MKKIKVIVYFVMIVQILGFSLGVLDLYEGKIFWGIFNTSINFIFFFVNINTLRIIKKTNKEIELLQKQFEEAYKPNWITITDKKEVTNEPKKNINDVNIEL